MTNRKAYRVRKVVTEQEWPMSYWNPKERNRRKVAKKMARISRRINRK